MPTKMRISLVHSILLLFTLYLLQGCQTEKKNVEVSETSTKVDRNMGGLGLPRGVIISSDELADGYVLFNPTNSASSYLMNRKGQLVHEWKGNFRSILSYLTERGSIIRNTIDPYFPKYYGGGNMGRIQEINWDGDMI